MPRKKVDHCTTSSLQSASKRRRISQDPQDRGIGYSFRDKPRQSHLAPGGGGMASSSSNHRNNINTTNSQADPPQSGCTPTGKTPIRFWFGSSTPVSNDEHEILWDNQSPMSARSMFISPGVDGKGDIGDFVRRLREVNGEIHNIDVSTTPPLLGLWMQRDKTTHTVSPNSTPKPTNVNRRTAGGRRCHPRLRMNSSPMLQRELDKVAAAFQGRSSSAASSSDEKVPPPPSPVSSLISVNVVVSEERNDLDLFTDSLDVDQLGADFNGTLPEDTPAGGATHDAPDRTTPQRPGKPRAKSAAQVFTDFWADSVFDEDSDDSFIRHATQVAENINREPKPKSKSPLANKNTSITEDILVAMAQDDNAWDISGDMFKTRSNFSDNDDGKMKVKPVVTHFESGPSTAIDYGTKPKRNLKFQSTAAAVPPNTSPDNKHKISPKLTTAIILREDKELLNSDNNQSTLIATSSIRNINDSSIVCSQEEIRRKRAQALLKRKLKRKSHSNPLIPYTPQGPSPPSTPTSPDPPSSPQNTTIKTTPKNPRFI